MRWILPARKGNPSVGSRALASSRILQCGKSGKRGNAAGKKCGSSHLLHTIHLDLRRVRLAAVPQHGDELLVCELEAQLVADVVLELLRVDLGRDLGPVQALELVA